MKRREYLPVLPVILLLLTGLALRAYYLRHSHPYIDEYFSILAAEMVQEHGIPRLPSGLFYSHGFFYTYVIALLGGLIKVAGPSTPILQAEMVYRVPNLLISVGAMAVLFSITRQWFGWRAGLVTLAFLAVFPHGIVWGARVRMYTLVYVFVPLLAYAFYKAVLHPNDRRWYGFALAIFAISLLVHNWFMVMLPWLIVGAGIIAWRYRVSAVCSWRWWGGTLVIIGIIAGGSSILASLGRAIPVEASQDVNIWGFMQALLGRLDPVASLLSNGNFWQEFIWQNTFNLVVCILTCLGGVGIIFLWSSFRYKRVADKHFWLMVYLYVLFFGVLLEFVFLLKPLLKQPRYASPIMLIAFIILGGWFEIIFSRVTFTSRLFSGQHSCTVKRMTFLVVTGILAGLGWLAYVQLPKIFYEGLPAVAYEQAFQFVRTNLQPGDVVLSPLPAAANLYLDNPGYFIGQDATYTFVHLNKNGIPGDRWMGAPWLRTTDDLKQMLHSSPRAWLVIDTFTLNSQFHSDWKQIMRYNTPKVWENDGVIVFKGEGLVHDLPTKPDIVTEVQLDNLVKLIGYSREISPNALHLTLFWQVLAQFPADYTIFVHIRNEAGENIAQADVQPLGGDYPTSRWRVGETITDEITISLPTELPSGTYYLLTGLYRWDTLERLPVVNDTSGENAILLETIQVQ